MKFFETLCVDNFFDNPDEIRKYALSLEYPEVPGHYPGKRSFDLKEINPDFYNAVCKKILSLFFAEPVNNYQVEMKFQVIEHQHPDKNSVFNKGWIHLDDSSSFAGLIYLNPEADLDTGTAIYKQVVVREQSLETFTRYRAQMESKNRFFLDGENMDYEKHMTEHNSVYVETIRFSNLYNRMICFESSQHHAATNIFVSGEPRLTLVFFVKGIDSQQNTNLMKMREIKTQV